MKKIKRFDKLLKFQKDPFKKHFAGKVVKIVLNYLFLKYFLRRLSLDQEAFQVTNLEQYFYVFTTKSMHKIKIFKHVP